MLLERNNKRKPEKSLWMFRMQILIRLHGIVMKAAVWGVAAPAGTDVVSAVTSLLTAWTKTSLATVHLEAQGGVDYKLELVCKIGIKFGI